MYSIKNPSQTKKHSRNADIVESWKGRHGSSMKIANVQQMQIVSTNWKCQISASCFAICKLSAKAIPGPCLTYAITTLLHHNVKLDCWAPMTISIV